MNMSNYPRLVNLTGEDVHVQVGPDIMPLEMAPEPEVVRAPTRPLDGTFSTGDNDFTMLVYTGEQVIGTFYLPVFDPTVMYLVKPEVLAQFPYRTDFVTPATWGMSGDDPENSQWVLAGVTRTIPATVSPETPDLEASIGN